MVRTRATSLVNFVLLTLLGAIPVAAQAPAATEQVLTAGMQATVDQSIDRALAWIAGKQRKDGSFEGPDSGQPGITGLCVLAFLSRGHTPGSGPYGSHLDRAIDYILICQRGDGLICHQEPGRVWIKLEASHTGYYNHAISALTLSEAFGMTSDERAGRIQAAVEKALAFTRERQLRDYKRRIDKGGWRYPALQGTAGSDLSVTSWQIFFLRSAKNAGFDVPAEWIEDALGYVKRCFDPDHQSFVYDYEEHFGPTRATSGAGILSMSMAGMHNTPESLAAAEWLHKNGFSNYNDTPWFKNVYHYSAFYASNAMFQLGGEHWRRFYPHLAKALTENQNRDGSWERDGDADGYFGNVYTTAMAVMALCPHYQMLPIFQR